ncbi:MAG: GNAT family N-acetyltransferase [Hyphomonadaceae bacterium]|nr:GNAT family N-acetyltransferase [Hyphomonadaceae bacterium]
MTLSPVPLENAFVRLDPLEERHREPLREAGDDPDLWRFANVNLDNTNFDAWMDHRLTEITNTPDLTWAVFDKASGSYVGSTSFLAIVVAHKRAEIGWTWYAKRVWAGPVNPSCKRMLLAHGFESLGFNRMELKADARNQRSCNAMERFGAKFEGIHRSHMVRPDGRLRDTAWFSVIREEWPAVRDGLDARLAAFAS